MNRKTFVTIQTTIENGALARMREDAQEAENATAKRKPSDPGYAHAVVQFAINAAEKRAKLEGYEQACREIFGMMTPGFAEEK